MLILYLAVLITALYWVVKMLFPEMAKPPLPKTVQNQNFPMLLNLKNPDNRIDKLETLLAEKNKNINLLQTELKIFHVQVRDFDKIKITA